jgi:hypothetical protein
MQSTWSGLAAVAGALLVVGDASALPREGDVASEARAEDADGRPFSLSARRGKPALIVYEDRASSEQNTTFKTELAKLAAGGRYQRAITLAAVADVSRYDFWPVKGFVKDAIREQSQKFGTTIYCDWNGGFRSALGLRSHASNVVLLDREGRVLFAASGPLDAAARRRVIQLLKNAVAP